MSDAPAAGPDLPVPRLRTAVWRGMRRRCPRCGIGTLSAGWFALRDECPHCRLRFEKSPGDTWGFWVLLDRIFVFVPVIILYFGLAPSSVLAQGLFFAALIAALVLTMPNRQGIGVAIDYLARVKQGQV